ncbi:hypothetical protein QFZ22_001258 [Streptomyces canus]|uniref:Uncharacterized protein n=1 Tax=Streptomyces canus TaxID=58343 RepID=A0AAW8F8X6_9ACTN|nr:hypothetical protein [Streptomyces canus]
MLELIAGSRSRTGRGPQPVHGLGYLLRIDGAGEHPHDRRHPEADQAPCVRRPTPSTRLQAAVRRCRPPWPVEGLGRLAHHIVTGPTPIPTDVGAQPTESGEVLATALGGDGEFRGIRPSTR